MPPTGAPASESGAVIRPDALIELTRAVSRARDLAAVYDAALDALRDTLHVSRASILLFDADGVMRFKAWRGLSDEYRRAVEGHTPWTPDTPNPEPIGVSNVDADPSLEAYRPIFDREGIVALAFIPLVSLERVVGKFMLYYGAPHELTPEERDIALTVAHLIAFAVERMRAHDAVRESEARLHVALHAATMGTWDWDLRTNTVRWSDNLEAVHGLPPGTFDGTFSSYEREIHPDDRQRVFASIQRALEHAVPHDVEYRIVRPDRSILWVQGTGQVERDEQGRPLRMVGVCRDISLRKETERLRDEEASFLDEVASALSSSLDYEATLRSLTRLAVPRFADCSLLYLRDDDGRIRRAAFSHRDPGWEAVLEELERQFPMTEALANRFSEVLETGRSQIGGIPRERIAAVAGGGRYAEILASLNPRAFVVVPLKLAGELVGALAWIRTSADAAYGPRELRLAEEVARRASVAMEHARLYRTAQDAIRQKDEFLATISHELRTPLNAILGWCRIMEKLGVEGEMPRKAIETVVRNAGLLSDLIGDLIDLSRAMSGKLRLNVERTDLVACARSAVDTVRPLCSQSGNSIEEALPDGPVPVMGDAMRLQQVIWNLLTNSTKFTPAGGSIRISVAERDGWACVEVTDTGHGIDAELLPYVFERFRQDDRRSNQGLGLGLSIARELVELHGGTIAARSAGEGRGATFIVQLPLAP